MFGKLFRRKPKLEIDPSKKLVLFVCTANLSRSPMAEAMFRKLIEGRSDIVAMSAGTKTSGGFHPTPEALTVLATHQYSTEGLHTKQLTKEMLGRANFVFTMSEVHLRAAQMMHPEGAEKFFLLTDMSDVPQERSKEVPDPHERPLHVYIEVYRILKRLLPHALEFIDYGPTEEWLYWYQFYHEAEAAKREE